MRKAMMSVILLAFCTTGLYSQNLPKVKIVTSLGEIMVEVDTIHAPVTAKNFLNYVEAGAYKNAAFYRVVRLDNQPNNDVKIEVIQGGLMDDDKIDKFKPIEHETTQQTGLRHLNGTISMARTEPGTASTEFFICIEDQPELDFGGKRNIDGQGFAAFGQVINGMNVVREIQHQKDKDQMLLESVLILNIQIVP